MSRDRELRGGFEDWARNRNHGVLSGFSEGQYHDPEDQSNWEAWQVTARKRPKLLCDHDVREVVTFQEHLRDKETMETEAFYRKYQEYMGLSDEELNVILANCLAESALKGKGPNGK